MSTNSTAHINHAMNAMVTDKPARHASAEDVQRFAGLESNVAYIEADAFSGNPYAILGTVIEVRKQDGACPVRLNAPGVVPDFSLFKIPGIRVDESSRIKEPVKRQSVLVDRKLTLELGFLHYLSAQLDAESSFSLLVFDQAGGLIDRDDDSWMDGVGKWKQQNQDLLEDDEVCYLFAVIGFVQKYVIRKTYRKFDAKTKGGAFGINIDGALYTSSEDYSLDIRYGLQPVTLKRPKVKSGLAPRGIGDQLTAQEAKLFAGIQAVRQRALNAHG